MELMASAGKTELYKDILCYKYHANMKPEWLMKPRKSAIPMQTLETRISALVSTPKSKQVYTEIHSSSSSSWKNLEPILTGFPISSVAEMHNVYYLACQKGFIDCYDMKQKKFKMSLKLPILRENCALVIYKNCIYVLGGKEYNLHTWKCDKPSSLTARYSNSIQFLFSASLIF